MKPGHFAPRGDLPDADLRSASVIDADDVAALITGEDAAEHPEESETEENSATTAQPVPK